MMLRTLAMLALASCCLSLGCSQADPLGRQSVSGEITLEGTPIKSGSIEFTPRGKGTSGGATIENGKYSISAERGLPPGDYRVRIYASSGGVDASEFPGESDVVAQELIPPEYNSQSEVSFKVESGKENIFNFDVPETASTE